eukprot:365596-Chlamydomonas_euryale.AAC.22
MQQPTVCCAGPHGRRVPPWSVNGAWVAPKPTLRGHPTPGPQGMRSKHSRLRRNRRLPVGSCAG